MPKQYKCDRSSPSYRYELIVWSQESGFQLPWQVHLLLGFTPLCVKFISLHVNLCCLHVNVLPAFERHTNDEKYCCQRFDLQQNNRWLPMLHSISSYHTALVLFVLDNPPQWVTGCNETPYHHSSCPDSWRPAGVSSHGLWDNEQTPQSLTARPGLCLLLSLFSVRREETGGTFEGLVSIEKQTQVGKGTVALKNFCI